MKKRRILTALLACVFAAFAFGGCGSPAPSGENPPESDPPSVVDPPSTEDPPGTQDPPADEKKPIDRTDIYINDDDDVPPEAPRPFDDSIKYEYPSEITYENKVGNFGSDNGVHTANIPGGDIALYYGTPFPYGTISCTVRSNNLVDAGFVFCASEAPSGAYNESNMSYYFYFLGMGGSAYLGKWDGPKNTWSALVVKSVGAVNANKDYELKVVLKSNYIVCYMDGEIMFGYKDKDFCEGTGFGIRVTAHPDVNPASSALGVTISDLTVTSDYIY